MIKTFSLFLHRYLFSKIDALKMYFRSVDRTKKTVEIKANNSMVDITTNNGDIVIHDKEAVESKSASRQGKERSQSSSIEKYHLIRNLSNDNSEDDQNKESQRDK